MEVLVVPATQLEGDETVICSHLRSPRQSTRRHRRTARQASATLVHLPPAAVREAMNLQNFFQFPRWREDEEEALEDDEEEEAAEWKEDFPAVATAETAAKNGAFSHTSVEAYPGKQL